MLTLIENGEIYAPEFTGQNAILLGAGKILKIGTVNRQILESLHIFALEKKRNACRFCAI